MDYFMEEPILNAHNKEEYPPMHTAEHIVKNAYFCKVRKPERNEENHDYRRRS